MNDTTNRGLTTQQAEESRQQHGDNVLTPVRKDSVWKLFIDKFKDPIIRILLIAAALSLVVGAIEGEYAEAIGIVVAILLATGVSFWFEYDAKRRFDILNVVNDDTPVKVVRDGHVTEIPKRDVVVGDLVVLATGDEIPADGKLVESVSMKVNESALTGEPSARKSTDPADTDPEATYPVDMLMRGTTVIEGSGSIEVTAVGDSTEYGKVAEQSTVESGESTPLNKQLNSLSKYIGLIGSGLAILIFFIMLAKGIFISKELIQNDWLAIAGILLKYFMISVVIMVMAVPEGLPMSITLSLAMSMRRMLRTNNLVRKMHACETMGAVTVICTDKTGTLTRNQMRVDEIKTFEQVDQESLSAMIALNSTAFIDAEGKVIGNPTEGALLLWITDQGADYESIRENSTIIDQMSFSTERKFMATLIETAQGRILYVKGAPEIVMGMCGNVPDTEAIHSLLEGYQNRAMRTLAFATAPTEATNCEEALSGKNLSLVAIAAISDPVREDVPDAVRRCLDAGIAIKIVTGDTPATAREIARQIGLWDENTDNEQNLITGTDFESLSDEELLERIDDLKIMARARPLDKQRLVKLLQQKGEVVAVTGDGTNDAPALNFAQVGLSMGSGTSVAKQASDITLLDDSFASIATAVMWGRSLYKNIQRFVLFQLTVNFTAMVVVFFGTMFGGELPLTVTQILWVNIIMDTFAALALASLPPDPKVMEEKPRRQSDFIISRSVLRNILITGSGMIAVLLGLLLVWGSQANIYRLTAFFTVFVLFHFWNLINAREYGTHNSSRIRAGYIFPMVMVAILAGQVAIVTWGGSVFRTVPLALVHWVWIIAGTSVIFLAGMVIRAISRNRGIR